MRWRDLWDANREVPQPDGRSWTDPQIIRVGWQLHLPAARSRVRPSRGRRRPRHVPAAVRTDRRTRRHPVRDRRRPPRRPCPLHGDLRPEPRRRTARRPTAHRPEPDPSRAGTSGCPTSRPQPRRSRPHRQQHPTSPTPTRAPDTGDATADTTPTTTIPPTSAPRTPTRRSRPTVRRHRRRLESDHTRRRPPGRYPARSTEPGTDDKSRRRSPGSPAPSCSRPGSPSASGSCADAKQPAEHHADHPMTDDSRRSSTRWSPPPTCRWFAGPASASPNSCSASTATPVTGAPVAVELSETAGIELLWDTPQPDAPDPWTAADGGWAWRLAYDPDAPVPADELPAAIPALVTIGHRDGRQLMIDLEAYGAITVTGDDDHVDAFLRSITIELATDQDLADAYVHIVGIDAGISHLDRLDTTDIDDAIRLLDNALPVSDRRARRRPARRNLRRPHRLADTDRNHRRDRPTQTRQTTSERLIQAAPPRRGVAVIAAGRTDAAAPARIVLRDRRHRPAGAARHRLLPGRTPGGAPRAQLDELLERLDTPPSSRPVTSKARSSGQPPTRRPPAHLDERSPSARRQARDDPAHPLEQPSPLGRRHRRRHRGAVARTTAAGRPTSNRRCSSGCSAPRRCRTARTSVVGS